MSRKYVRSLLVEWGSIVMGADQISPLSAETVIARLMEAGTVVQQSMSNSSNYWPDHTMVMINNAIEELGVEDRNLITRKYATKEQLHDIGIGLGISKWGVMKRLTKIEDELLTVLQ